MANTQRTLLVSVAVCMLVVTCRLAIALAQGGAEQKPTTQPQRPAHQPPVRTYESAYYPGRQQAVMAEGHGLTLALNKSEQCPGRSFEWRCFAFDVRDKRRLTVAQLKLANDTAQIDEAHIVSRSRAVVVGRRGNLSIVNVFDLQRQTLLDFFYCLRPSFSGDSQLVAYIKFFPEHLPGSYPSFEYLVYDLTASPEDNRAAAKMGRVDPYNVGWPVYPPEAKNLNMDNLFQDESQVHYMSSRGIFWLGGKHAFAFMDVWKKTQTIVVADVTGDLRHPKVTVRRLEPEEVVDTSRGEVCKQYYQSPFGATDMYLLQDRPGILRVEFAIRFQPGGCLRLAELEIHLGPIG